MKEVIIKIVYAFCIDGIGGNPAGIVLNADNLTNEEKQLIATKVGLSEIAFVSKSNHADFKLDFFTPTRQIAHCGHATIATFTYLMKNGFITGDHSSKETIDGRRGIYFKNKLAYMEQTSPSYKNVEPELPEILESLNLSKADLLADQLPSIVNTGNSFLIVPVASTSILRKMDVNKERIIEYSEKHNLIGYYIFSPATEENIAASTRMFAPRYGIDEEAATGMAAGPLACYLYDNGFITASELTIKQGEYMKVPSPSLIRVTLLVEKNKIKKLYVGGDAFVAEEINVKF